jgi:phospholipase C
MPPVNQALPMQEQGVKPARSLSYELQAISRWDNGQLHIDFQNKGRLGACFHVRSSHAGDPRYYTVEAGKTLSPSWPVQGAYALHAYGPNGFVRSFKGDSASRKTILQVASRYHRERGGLVLTLENQGHDFCNVTVENLYNGESVTYMLKPGEHAEKHWFLGDSYGWYDLVVRADAEAGFVQRLAGHVETGEPGVTDPAIGQVRWQDYQKL